jgi:SAM-dependent methyltransferase
MPVQTAPNTSNSSEHRAYVGPIDRYDLMAATQFNFLTIVGLRETSTLLDIGCGSLRAGKLFIPYLRPGKYFGVEPEQELVEQGIRQECGQDLIDIKQPSFLHVDDWSFEQFGEQFDFLLAQSIFSHASQAQIVTCLSNAARCMHSESIFAATFVLGNTDYEGSEWVYPGKVPYTPATIARMLGQAGLVGELTNWRVPSQVWYLIGKPENRAALIAHRNRVNALQFSNPVWQARFQKSAHKNSFHNPRFLLRMMKRLGATVLRLNRK